MKTIILASKSQRRKSLLRQMGIKFVVIPSLADEKLNPRLKPKGQAEALSLKKAESVAQKYQKVNEQQPAIIISADTIVAVNDEVLGKPKSEKESRQMLRKLSGKKHSVITGFTILDIESKKIVTKSIETYVYFRNISEREINLYIKKEKLSDKAGSYAIQGIGAVFVERIDGDYNNIVGLPLYSLAGELRKFGVEVF